MFKKQKLLALTITIVFALFFILIQSVQASDTFVFNKNLQTGNINNDVKELQKFLNNNGFVLNKSGFGSLGKETTFFGLSTRNALIKFQKANKITPAAGYFGSITRNVVNNILNLLPAISKSLENKVDNSLPTDKIKNKSNRNIKDEYYTIGGSITGIVGSVVLQNNGKDDLAINLGDNSNFKFITLLTDGASYNITVKSNYINQTCYVNNGIGVINKSNVENIKVACGVNLLYNPFTFIPSGATVTRYSLVYTASTGGTISGNTSQTINSGSSGSTVIAVPDAGYSFVGWSDGILTAERTDTSVTSNKFASAIFVINTYTITFDVNSGDGGATASQTLIYNTPTSLTANGFTKTGYTFAGWATTTDGVVGYADGASYTIGTEDVTLYAKWTINTYTVTFDTNGGDGGATASQTLIYNTPTNLTANGFTRTSYTFAGWATTTDGVVGYADGASYTIGTEDVTLYAKWNSMLVIGDEYQGGKIAYIFQDGDLGYVEGEIHGLIAATVNQSAGIIWAKVAYQSTAVPGGTDTTLGSGATNTDRIIAQNGVDDNTYAAGKARAYDGGGYDDWYLPSLDELTLLYINRVIIGGFSADYYWSSTEGGVNSAWSKHFTVSSISNQLKDTRWTYVRAVRSF